MSTAPPHPVSPPPSAPVPQYNIKLSLWWTVFENISASIRSGDALSAFLYLTTKKNSIVGFIQGINGVLQLLVALPAGWLADSHRRDSVLRFGAVIGLLGALLLAWALYQSSLPPAIAISIAMAVLGCYRGIYSPSLEALFADSVLPGRSSPYSWRYVTMILSSAVGPLISLFVFLRLGDSWSVEDCRLVVVAGLVGMLPALVLMCCFDDDKVASHNQNQHQYVPRRISALEETTQPLLMNEDNDDDDEEEEDEEQRSLLRRPVHTTTTTTTTTIVAIPVLLTISDVFGAFASGMTIKFFPLFFMQRVDLSPVYVSLLSTLGPIAVALASVVAQRASKRIGRIQLSVGTRVLDIGLLITMAFLPTASASGGGGGVWDKLDKAKIVLIIVHIVRMASANCTRPLMRSVLNQYTPRHHRGKVNAVDSVRTFSWSGSAALGGVLVQKFGFEKTFLVTAGVKVLSVLPLLFLIGYMEEGIFSCCFGGGSGGGGVRGGKKDCEDVNNEDV